MILDHDSMIFLPYYKYGRKIIKMLTSYAISGRRNSFQIQEVPKISRRHFTGLKFMPPPNHPLWCHSSFIFNDCKVAVSGLRARTDLRREKAYSLQLMPKNDAKVDSIKMKPGFKNRRKLPSSGTLVHAQKSSIIPQNFNA